MNLSKTKALLCAVCLSLALSSVTPPVCTQTPGRAETIEVDASAPPHPFPHYWERMFGSGRAILSLREGYRRDLREVKQATARCWGSVGARKSTSWRSAGRSRAAAAWMFLPSCQWTATFRSSKAPVSSEDRRL